MSLLDPLSRYKHKNDSDIWQMKTPLVNSLEIFMDPKFKNIFERLIEIGNPGD